MEKTIHLQTDLSSFASWLCGEGRSRGTTEKYLRDLRALAGWLNGRELTKETAAQWREHLLSHDYAPVTVNSMLAAVNAYCRFAGADIRVKFVKVQRKLFR